jgi:raffinose/stachyose/melibiose transport system substrate-binding protein
VGGTAPFAAIARGDEEAWSDPAITRALELLRQLIDAGAFGEDWASATADDSDDVALFYSGGAGLLLQGSWIYGTIKEQAQDFIDAGSLDTGVFPTVSGGTGDPAAVVGNPAQYWSVAAKADAAAQDTAIGYLDTEVLTESYVDTMISHGGIPPVAGVEAKLAASPDASYLTKAYALVRDAPSFQQSWDQALDPAVADALLAAVAGFFDGSLTADEFITTMNGTL